MILAGDAIVGRMLVANIRLAERGALSKARLIMLGGIGNAE